MSRSRGCMSVTIVSPITTSPSVNPANPPTIRSSVDLPQPDGPTSTMNSPSSICIETRSTATTSEPNTLVTSSSRIRATSPLPSGSDHPVMGQRRPGPCICSFASPDLVKPEQRRADHRRCVDDAHPGGWRDRCDAVADAREQPRVAATGDATAVTRDLPQRGVAHDPPIGRDGGAVEPGATHHADAPGAVGAGPQHREGVVAKHDAGRPGQLLEPLLEPAVVHRQVGAGQAV